MPTKAVMSSPTSTQSTPLQMVLSDSSSVRGMHFLRVSYGNREYTIPLQCNTLVTVDGCTAVTRVSLLVSVFSMLGLVVDLSVGL